MKTFSDFLNEVKTAQGLKNDSKLAEWLGISRAYMSEIRHTGNASDELCEKLAEASNNDPILVQLARDALKGPEKKRAQIQAFLAKHVAAWATAAILTFMSVLTVAPLPARAGVFTETHVMNITPESSQVSDFITKTGNKDYRKYRILSFIRRLLRKIAGFFGTVSRNSPFMPAPSFR